MKLFSSTLMSWNEPYLFVVRLRERPGWIRRGLLALAIAVVLFLAMSFFRNPQFGLGGAIGISLLAGVFLVSMLDVGSIQREVSITDEGIHYNSAVEMGFSWHGSFAFKDIRFVRLLRLEDWNRPFSAMLIHASNDTFLLGVPNKVSLATIANVLHRVGVTVELPGWEPSETDTRVQVKDEVVLPAAAGRPAGNARIWPVDQQEPRLNPPSTIAIAIVMALGPLLLSLLGLIAAGVYLFLKWGELATSSKWMIAGGAFGAVILSFLYLLLIGQFLAARYSIHVARGILRARPNARFGGMEEELIPVEIFDRSAWTSTISKSVDYGFLQIDERLGCLKFEGDKNRWEIPISALTTCRIEEAHVGSEGNPNAEKRCYVVISCDHDGEPWEAGMVYTRTEFGNDGPQQRYARAQSLFRRISEVAVPV